MFSFFIIRRLESSTAYSFIFWKLLLLISLLKMFKPNRQDLNFWDKIRITHFKMDLDPVLNQFANKVALPVVGLQNVILLDEILNLNDNVGILVIREVILQIFKVKIHVNWPLVEINRDERDLFFCGSKY